MIVTNSSHLWIGGIGLFAGKLTFREPDRAKYPCIDLAYSAGRMGGSMTAAMNGANERANEIFRQEVISVRKVIAIFSTKAPCVYQAQF